MSKISKSDVLSKLRERVLSMALAPGTALDEIVLAQEFGLSRTPLREIVQRLGGEGYLVLEPNRGARVAPMDLATMRHFFEAAPMIYAAMSRLAAQNARPNEVGDLKNCQQRYKTALAAGDVSATAMENHAFHHCIGEMARSSYLLPALERLLIDHTRIGHTFYDRAGERGAERTRQASDQHDAMIEAIEQREPGRAVEVTLEHWSLSRDLMETYVRPDPLNFQLEESRDAV
ncbi:GntR family transcriptional regulator [Ahrensia sp. R2A130]|uniref:GntR family transcriptional regulator n=1 Tax=Ahrensia sp. R2A130 TaxID=744979 RepID=UPI0001E0B4E8|nr:GntR family transcriptional regulator [Ahrensia sp. R2A130]EFL88468.1 transcriptional regulator, GntR family [Ahrensia sp. R2A130]